MSRRKKTDWGPGDTNQEIKASLPEVPKPSPAKKDTRRWCRGKVGVEHVSEVRLDRYGYRLSCGWVTDWSGGWWEKVMIQGHPQRGKYHPPEPENKVYRCSHQVVCTQCGKILEFRLKNTECPDYVEKTTDL